MGRLRHYDHYYLDYQGSGKTKMASLYLLNEDLMAHENIVFH